MLPALETEYNTLSANKTTEGRIKSGAEVSVTVETLKSWRPEGEFQGCKTLDLHSRELSPSQHLN